MTYANQIASRHYGNICHLILKMENRFGPADEILVPFLCEKESARQYPGLGRLHQHQHQDRSESLATVTSKYWGLRLDRIKHPA